MKKNNWSIILNVILAISTIGSFVFGIYAFFYNKSPSLSLYKTSEINVLEINRSLDDLKIFYKDEDIKNSNKNIKIINLQIKNDGKIDITQNMYDDELPWGILIEEGNIVQARVIDASNNYLLKNLEPSIINNSIVFNKTIIESGESFSIELVVLCENKVPLQYKIIGKIAGINNSNIKIIENNSGQEKSFWSELFIASVGIHFGRFVLYFLCIIIIIIIIIGITCLVEAIKDYLIHHERKTRIKLVITDDDKGPHFKEIQNFYIYHGYNALEDMLSLLNNPKKLESTYQKKLSFSKEEDKNSLPLGKHYLYFSMFSTINNLLALNIIQIKDEKVFIDMGYKDEIKYFLKCIKQ